MFFRVGWEWNRRPENEEPGTTWQHWLAPALPLAAGAIFLLGGTYMICMTSISTAVLLKVPRTMQGRVASLYSLTLGSGYAAGLIISAIAGHSVGASG